MIKFKGTQEALAYGQSIKNDPQLIYILRKQWEKYSIQARQLMDDGKQDEALYLASGQLQFSREALEEV